MDQAADCSRITAQIRIIACPKCALARRNLDSLACALYPTRRSEIPRNTRRAESNLPSVNQPLLYEGLLYVLNNNGLFDCYDWKTGEEIYRQRLPVIGSGFSASPIAADGKIYLSNEDGDMLVIAAGRKFENLGTNSIGELLMATPALSESVMYVRSAQSVLAVGRKR
jgi:outer membrane protein assembly factor BamB